MPSVFSVIHQLFSSPLPPPRIPSERGGDKFGHQGDKSGQEVGYISCPSAQFLSTSPHISLLQVFTLLIKTSKDMRTRNLFIALTMMTATAAITACSNDDNLETVDLNKPIDLNLSIGQPGTNTRASVSNGGSASRLRVGRQDQPDRRDQSQDGRHPGSHRR